MQYHGSCHCGKVAYDVDVDLSNVIACNCSICAKRGSILAFAPESALKMQSGENNLTDYQFNKKIIHHMFCKDCGILPFGRGISPDGSKVVAINVRCLDGVDPENLNITPFDGRSL